MAEVAATSDRSPAMRMSQKQTTGNAIIVGVPTSQLKSSSQNLGQMPWQSIFIVKKSAAKTERGYCLNEKGLACHW